MIKQQNLRSSNVCSSGKLSSALEREVQREGHEHISTEGLLNLPNIYQRLCSVLELTKSEHLQKKTKNQSISSIKMPKSLNSVYQNHNRNITTGPIPRRNNCSVRQEKHVSHTFFKNLSKRRHFDDVLNKSHVASLFGRSKK